MNVSVNRPSSLAPSSAGGSSRGDQGGLIVVFLVLLFATFLFSANSSSGQRSAIAGVVAMLLFPLAWFVPRAGLPAMVSYLMVMGGFRRFLIPLLGYTEFDPLLLVGPAVATICFVNLAINRQLRPTTQIGKWAIGLMICMGIAVFNPLQGSPLVGLTGAAFYLVPLMWYCIGRNVGTQKLIQIILQVVLVTSVLGAFLGLKQQFFGFSAAELQWFRLSSFSNQVGATQRAMSFYTSPAEYANFLAIGIVICFSYYLKGKKGFVLLALFLAYAMFMTGIRNIVFGCSGACMIMWGIQGRDMRAWLPRVIIAGLLIVIGGYFSLQKIGDVAVAVGGGSSGAELVTHQVEGLTDPLAKNSSVHSHIDLVTTGIIMGIKMPIGYGLGASTMGSGRFGGSTFFNAEYDIGSIFYSLGIIGGICFISSVIVTYRAAALYWNQTREYAPMIIIGVLVCANGNWLTPGHYAESVLVWMLIGSLDRCWRDGRAIPGFKTQTELGKGSMAIWKRVLARRLSGASPSWQASYRRPGVRPRMAGRTPRGGVETNAAVRRVTPSAERALARAKREVEVESVSGEYSKSVELQ